MEKAGLGTMVIKRKYFLLLSAIESCLPNPKPSRYFRPLILFQTVRNVAPKRLLGAFRIREGPRQNLVPESGYTTRVTLDTNINADNRVEALNSTVQAIYP